MDESPVLPLIPLTWLIEYRAQIMPIASASVGMSGTSSNRILLGRWVKAIVCKRPINSANFAANSAENPANRLQTNTMVPSTTGSVEYLRSNPANQKTINTMDSMGEPLD